MFSVQKVTGAFDLVGSRERDRSQLVCREARIPPGEVASQQAVDVTDSDLQESMCAEWGFCRSKPVLIG